VRVHTQSGVGTAVTMIVPATVATFTGTLVGAGGQRFLVPTSAVERVVRVAPADIGHLEGREAVAVGDRLVPVARLGELLDLPLPEAEPRADAKVPCLVLQADDASVGLLVEEVHGNHEGLVKEFGPPLVRVRHVAAAGLLGSGDLALILRPSDLVASVRELGGGTRRREPRAVPRATPSILVVDDSITTRTMEKNLLEAAGYRVRTAVDGVDAWTLLKSERFDLVLSDVDMPRMSGFDLTARVREDRELGDLPIVLVTALESREDKERGIEVGANAYIVKSGFDQSKLLETIRRLL
jgi:two-component system, chemotaxis family, sensor kinase CheA